MKILFYYSKLLKSLKNQFNYRFEDKYSTFTVIYNKFYILKKNKFFNQKVCKINFSSNNYLCLSFNKAVIASGVKALKSFGSGSTSSKFITGYSYLYKLIEDEIKLHKNVEDCVIFTSGYNANVGIFESLFNVNDIIFLDEHSHASSFTGAKLCGAKIMRFKHNNIKDLKSKIEKFKPNENGKIGIFIETVFSMQGTVIDKIEEYFELSKQKDAILITDEAHSFGILKFHFPFYVNHIQIGTFSKAVGVLGGYVCGNGILIDTIRQFARSGIYTTALPASILASILTSLKLIFQNKVNGKKALQNAKLFGELVGVVVYSHIVFIETKTNEKAIQLEEEIYDLGYIVKAIRKPTVKIPGVRVSFNNFHKNVDIKKLAFIIKEYLKYN